MNYDELSTLKWKRCYHSICTFITITIVVVIAVIIIILVVIIIATFIVVIFSLGSVGINTAQSPQCVRFT